MTEHNLQENPQFGATHPTQRALGGLPLLKEASHPAPQDFFGGWRDGSPAPKTSIAITCNLVTAFFLPLGWGRSQVPLGLLGRGMCLTFQRSLERGECLGRGYLARGGGTRAQLWSPSGHFHTHCLSGTPS